MLCMDACNSLSNSARRAARISSMSCVFDAVLRSTFGSVFVSVCLSLGFESVALRFDSETFFCVEDADALLTLSRASDGRGFCIPPSIFCTSLPRACGCSAFFSSKNCCTLASKLSYISLRRLATFFVQAHTLTSSAEILWITSKSVEGGTPPALSDVDSMTSLRRWALLIAESKRLLMSSDRWSSNNLPSSSPSLQDSPLSDFTDRRRLILAER
mmetsp:Transcript_42573/g.117454  ORF Transcript_42573/g.117454 Transcript_42573/m.117454 type:complete len:215 (-) Transcript_42573:270-914(-)